MTVNSLLGASQNKPAISQIDMAAIAGVITEQANNPSESKGKVNVNINRTSK